MLSGHNRANAAKLAGLTEVPAIVKADLPDEEAYVYVIETNLMQRSFNDLMPSEKAAVMAAHYDKVCCQGKRNDIIRELKIAELALGYGGSVGALKSMGAIEMGLAEEELQPLVDSWRAANPNIVKFWWDVDRAVKTAVKQKKQADVNGIRFFCQSGMLFIQLPSGRRLAYVKPRMGLNRFDEESSSKNR